MKIDSIVAFSNRIAAKKGLNSHIVHGFKEIASFVALTKSVSSAWEWYEGGSDRFPQDIFLTING